MELATLATHAAYFAQHGAWLAQCLGIHTFHEPYDKAHLGDPHQDIASAAGWSVTAVPSHDVAKVVAVRR